MGLFLREPPQPKPIQASAEPVEIRSARAVPYGSVRPITASAERIAVSSITTESRPYSAWQGDAWTAYERVGEIHFGFNLLANLLSRVRFFPAALGSANEEPVDVSMDAAKKRISEKLIAAAVGIMADLQSHDWANSVRCYSLNFSIPGECYLMGLKAADKVRWSIRSTQEIQPGMGGVQLVPMRNSTKERVTLPEGTFLARMWRPHPAYSKEPDSSMVGVADSVEELLMLQRLVRSATRTRLNAGMLFVPDGVASAMTGKSTGEPVIEETDDPLASLAQSAMSDPSGKFLTDLMESMTTPISDEGSASAVVPMLVMGPGELGQQIQHITFERSSDQWLTDRIEKVLDRVMSGIDLPKEVVTGLQNVRYSNAVVIDEGMYKANLEPLALTFSDGLTDVFLRPQLRAQGFSDEDINAVVVWYDPAAIVTRPNSADEATQGIDRGLLSPAAWRREHGYAESDAPEEQDLARVMLQKLTVLPPEAAMALLKSAMPKILKDVEVAPTENQQQQNPQDGESDPNVVQFPQHNPAQPAADSQRTAVKQVGVK